MFVYTERMVEAEWEQQQDVLGFVEQVQVEGQVDVRCVHVVRNRK